MAIKAELYGISIAAALGVLAIILRIIQNRMWFPALLAAFAMLVISGVYKKIAGE